MNLPEAGKLRFCFQHIQKRHDFELIKHANYFETSYFWNKENYRSHQNQRQFKSQFTAKRVHEVQGISSRIQVNFTEN